jgi:hypothetical protein
LTDYENIKQKKIPFYYFVYSHLALSKADYGRLSLKKIVLRIFKIAGEPELASS